MKRKEKAMNLCEAELGLEYLIKEVKTGDEELNSFLFSLGCYSGEKVTVVTRGKSGMVVALKDARYHIDSHLGEKILV